MRSIAELEMNRPRVLVVDDSASTCLLIASALQQKGYDVKIAHNGQDGLTKTIIFQPHCLILDVLLPGMSGYTVCRQVRQRLGQRLPHIILISTKDTALDQHYGLHQGADRYLPKPFTEETLLQAVWEGVPATVRRAISPPLSSTPTLRPALWELVPQRIANREAMRTSSPFARSAATTDERARRLYVAIDGRKTVAELAAVTGLETKDVSKLLRVLLQDHCIELQDAEGQLVETALVSVSSWGNDLAG
ncbi:MAG TPA: response regulator [Ktedonobacteraceae bacterium]|nr:response regulator [Ktedonobacteraceae bacterium]